MKKIRPLLTLILIFTLPSYAISAQISETKTSAGKIVSIQGELEISRDGGKTWLNAEIDQLLYEGDILRTGAYCKAAILLSDETQMKIHPKSEILIKSIQDYELKQVGIPTVTMTAMHVEKGQGWFRAKRPGTKFKVTTPIAFAGIRGTEINVSVDEEKEESIVTVVEGRVEYGNEAGTIILTDGDQGIIRRGQVPQKVTLINPEDAVQWSLYYMGIVSYRDYPFITNDRETLNQMLTKEPLTKIEEAKIYHDLGELDKAKEILAGMEPDDEVNTLWGWVYLEERDLANAIVSLDKVRVDSIYSILGKSKIYYLKGEIQKALDVILKEDYENSPELLAQLGYVYLSRGLTDSAMEYLQKAIDVSPEYGLAHGFLSNFYIVTNKVDLAIDAARKSLDFSPYSPSAYVDMSIVYQALFDLELAKEYAKKAVDLDPANSYALYQYAKILFGFGYNKEAELQVIHALQYHPNDSLINALYGFILFARSATDESIDIFKLAVKLDSTQGQPHLGLGLSYFRKKKYNEGIREMLIATLLEPKVSLYQSYMGKSYYQAKRFTEAEDAINYAKKLDPKDPTPYLYGGNIKRDLYRYVESVEDIQKSIELNDNRAVYRSRLLLDKDTATRSVDLALTYRDLGLYNWALKEAVLSLESDVTNGSAHLFFAKAIINLPNRVTATATEALKAFFLMPVNQNVFNTFNDYTSMLEVPYNRFTIFGRIGEYNLRNQEIEVLGGSDKYAYSTAFVYEIDDGIRGFDDFERERIATLTTKFQLDQDSDLFFSYGGINFNYKFPALIERFYDPFKRSTQIHEAHHFQLGYHKKLKPESDILLLGEFRYSDLRRNRHFFGDFYEIDPLSILVQHKTDYYTLKGIHMLDLDKHQLQYGFDYFYGPKERLYKTKDYLGSELLFELSQLNKDLDRYLSLYMQDIWSLWDRFDLTIGGEYKYVDQGNVSYYLGNTLNLTPGVIEKEFNPQLGIKYEISDNTILRGAAFKTLENSVKYNLSPTNISGFIIDGGIGTSATTNKTEYDLGIEHEFDNRTFGFMSLLYRDTDTPLAKGVDPELESSTYKRIDLGLEKILNKYLTFTTYYWLSNFNVPIYEREDHHLEYNLTFNFGQGWRIGLSEIFDRFNFEDVDPQYRNLFKSDRVWLTNLTITKEFPEKMGALHINLYNVFDEEFSYTAYPMNVIEYFNSRFDWLVTLEFRF